MSCGVIGHCTCKREGCCCCALKLISEPMKRAAATTERILREYEDEEQSEIAKLRGLLRRTLPWLDLTDAAAPVANLVRAELERP